MLIPVPPRRILVADILSLSTGDGLLDGFTVPLRACSNADNHTALKRLHSTMLTNEHSWAGRQVGAVTFSDQEVEEFREVFELVDVDKGGTIEADEVGGRGNPAAAWIRSHLPPSLRL